MAIGKISGPMLQTNLERQGVDLSVDTNTVYIDVTNKRLGVNTTPGVTLDINGNANIASLRIAGNVISSTTGKIDLGSPANVVLRGGTSYDVLYTDGAGNLGFANLNIIAGLDAFTGNNVALGSNTAGYMVSNAVTLTTTTTVTDAVAQLNYVLGKLVPPAPPNFPNNTTISITTGTINGLMANFTQNDNSGWGNLSVGAGTSVNVVRSATYSTTAVTNVGPGSTGTIIAYVNGVPKGNVTLTGTNADTTDGNITVYGVQDYHNILSSVTAGFWTVFSTYASAGSGMLSGWNRVYIYDSGTGAQTNNATWYYDASVPGTPVFSNTSIALTSNVVSYSSKVPHFNSSTTFKIKGNVANLSGDLYLASPFGTSGGGAFDTPTTPSYSSFVPSIATPVARNLSASKYFETAVNITSGFGSSSSGPSISFSNPYAGGSSGTIAPGVTVLYKTGTSNNIEETRIPVIAVGTGSGNGLRIVNPGSTDNPVYTGSEAAFNSTTGPFYTYDATNVASVIKFDQTNYSSGYLPVGPNLTGQGANQYFTFKFTRTTVNKFDVLYSGSIAGLWVALPGSAIDTTAGLTNGWLDMSFAYAGSGTPGTGTGGNGSNGCSTGGAALLNSAQTNKSVTATFGTVQSGYSGSNTGDIYVRIKLTNGQSLTGLSIVTATH